MVYRITPFYVMAVSDKPELQYFASLILDFWRSSNHKSIQLISTDQLYFTLIHLDRKYLKNVASNADLMLLNSIAFSVTSIISAVDVFVDHSIPISVTMLQMTRTHSCLKYYFDKMYLFMWLLEHVKKKKKRIGQRCLTPFSFVITKHRLLKMLFYFLFVTHKVCLLLFCNTF